MPFIEDELELSNAAVQADDEEDLGYTLDSNFTSEESALVVQDLYSEDTKYYGVDDDGGIPILDRPDGEPVDTLMPGFVVAAKVPQGSRHAKLLDGRGWLPLDECVHEVNPWAARIMKKMGMDRDDAMSLAYLNVDYEDDELSPLSEHLPLPGRVVRQLQASGVTQASPIQEAVFSRIHRGESMCLQSQTGSGKTLAMILPLLAAMSEESEWGIEGDKIIVVTAHRELAVQLFSDIDKLGFYPQGKGFATLVIVGNLPAVEQITRANIIIGTANELSGVLHKEDDIIKALNTKLRAIVLDEVDDYTTAPKIFGPEWSKYRKRKVYNEHKMVLDNALKGRDNGRIEWFMKRQLAYTRRRDLQVLAASATMTRNIAYKVHRMLRWDPLGRWFNKPPPLLRPSKWANVDWQNIPRMPTVPLHLQHRYVQVVRGPSDVEISDNHWKRRPYERGGLPRLRKRSPGGQSHRGAYGGRFLARSGFGARPVNKEMASSLMDGLHDALASRGTGSCMVLVMSSMGISIREVVQNLHDLGFYEAEALHKTLWTDAKDWPSRWAEKYTYDKRDHSAELAEKHMQLNERTLAGQHKSFPVGSFEWSALEQRKDRDEVTSPILVGFEGACRGLHFDGVETVYMLGLPRKPEVYLHLAGRVGRLGQTAGKVVSIVPKRGTKVLHKWRKHIGPNVEFDEEPIRRNLSMEVLPDGSRSQGRQRGRLPQRIARDSTDEPLSVPLLPRGEDYVPLPGNSDEDNEFAVPEFDRVLEAQELAAHRQDVKSRRAMRRLTRSTRPL